MRCFLTVTPATPPGVGRDQALFPCAQFLTRCIHLRIRLISFRGWVGGYLDTGPGDMEATGMDSSLPPAAREPPARSSCPVGSSWEDGRVACRTAWAGEGPIRAVVRTGFFTKPGDLPA